jgi:cellulose synthase/poly-beta-1,6-N-acetylglucosamine synthase-like glycosyltransferase
VPAFNASRDIDACLRSLLGQSVARDRYEVLVVDDGSTDNTAEIVAMYPVRLLRQAHAGPASARNHGARGAKGEFFLFTDADCVPVQTWIEEIARPLEADSRVAASKGVYRTKQQGLISKMAQVEFEEKYAHLRRQPYIDFVDTSSAAFRADAFWQAGGFDTGFGAASNEDTLLSFTLSALGWRMVFCESAVVYHRHSETLMQYLRRKWRHGYWRVRVYQRHPAKMAGDSYTPRSTQLQMASAVMGLLLAVVPATRRLAIPSLGVFLLATLPFVRRALPVGGGVAAIVPAVLFLRALALCGGLVVGAIHLRLLGRVRRGARGTRLLRTATSTADASAHPD